MPVTAKLIFTQAPGGTRPAGYDVADGVVGNLVTITNEDNTGIASWSLAMADVPVGPETDCISALTNVVFASGTAPLVLGTFTPDCFGGFRVVLTVIGTDGSIAVSHGVFGCPNELGWFRPAFKQAVESSEFGGQGRGWAYNTDKIQRDTRDARNKTTNLKQEHALVIGLQQTDQTGFVTVGGRRLNPSDFLNDTGDITRSITFRAELYATVGMTAQVRVFNLTDGVQIAATVLSTANNTPTAVSASMHVPSELPNANKLYEAQLRISAGAPGPLDRAFLLYAGFDITLTG